MKKKPYVKPSYVMLDLAKAEKATLREHVLAENEAGESDDPALKLLFAKIASQLREKRER